MKRCIIDVETNNYLPWNDSTIICIGIMNLTNLTKHVFCNENESELVTSFIRYFNSRNFTEIIGYNIAFDLRFILSRCLKYQIPAKHLYYAKITDIMKIMSLSIKGENFNKPGKMGEWSWYLFNKKTLNKNGSVKDLFTKGEIDEIVAHNHRDLDLTYQLWNRIQRVINGGEKP